MSEEAVDLTAVDLPQILRRNTKIGGVTWLAGAGPRTADVMLVTSVVSEEEAAEQVQVGYEKWIPRTPRMLDSPQGIVLKDIAIREGIDLEKIFAVPIVRYLPEKKYRNKPKQSMLNACLPLLHADIAEVKPKIIICMGKQVFDTIVKLSDTNGKSFRARESEIMGAWFYSKEFNARMYYMPAMIQALNPEKHERFLTDFAAVKRMLDATEGLASAPFETDYKVIRNSAELKEFVAFLRDGNFTELSIDCEWHGQQHVDGKLRTFQICWESGKAVAIRFMDDKLQYAFDIPYKEAGAILGEWLNQPQVKYIGHHVSADLPWMYYWLGLEWYEKAKFDTEFALQACDESAELGLDALALKYTDLGKYDWDLITWKKTNVNLCKDGYGLIPDDILLPYAAADVDATYRSYLIIKEMLKKQDLITYYNEILNPLVTDVFTAFCLTGLPIDTARMDEMRKLYTWAKEELQKEFQIAVAHEADTLLFARLAKALGPEEGVKLYDEIIRLCGEGKVDEAGKLFRSTVGPAKIAKLEPVFEHFLIAPNFNIRSKPQMQRWLFAVKEYTPIKSTANKDAGMPSVSWDKVLTYPPDKQRTFTPASDKGTLEVLAARHSDEVIGKLLELNAVGNICKAFLKPADIDEDTGELIRENGLHYWVSSDACIHLNNSCTETGRIRSWNPNVLNWPSWVHARLGAGMVRIIKERNEQGRLPEDLKKYATTKAKDFPTIRSAMMARPGWCVVEADYKTAEMRGLAYIAGDAELIKLIEEPDDCFALPKPECIPDNIDAEDCVVRIKFPEYIKSPDDRDKYLMTYSANGSIKATFTEDQLQKDVNGKIISPGFDMHWGVLELARGHVREELDKKKDRGAGKVVNFCLTGDALVLTNHGEKPIKSVQGSDLLWDGISWVKHKGIVKYENKWTISYAGITATPDHLVWTSRGVFTLLEAAIRGETLTKTAEAGIPVTYTGTACACRERKSKQRQQAKAVCASRMPSLWKGILEEFGKLSTREGNAMSLQGAQKVQNNSECYLQTIRTALQLHDAKMLLWLTQTISRLQRQGYQSMLLLEGGIYNLGIQRLSRGDLSWEGVRSYRQQRRLFEDESSPCDELDKSPEHEESFTFADTSGEVYGTLSTNSISTCNAKELDATGIIRSGDFRAIRALLQRLQAEDKVLRSRVQNDVYDIVDAGEYHRFTANGYLVANSSSYGGQAASLQRKIEADTGNKPELDDVQAMLDAIERRQPRATQFFKELESVPTEKGYIRAASGRLRHCHTLSSGIKGLSSRTREGQITALGRECRNFP